MTLQEIESVKKYFVLIALLFVTITFAAPREIVLIRHADKWPQKNPGPFLSPKGQLRAERFIFYFIGKFGRPNYIFFTNTVAGKKGGKSFRELQTVAPLANYLAEKNPAGFSVEHPYVDNDYGKLATDLLSHAKYHSKLVLVCWHHGKLNDLAKKLGVNKQLAKWKADVFDTVYVLKYHANGHLKSFKKLKNQYPVKQNPSWQDMESR